MGLPIMARKNAVDKLCKISSGNPAIYEAIIILKVGLLCIIITDAGFVIPPYIIRVDKKPKMQSIGIFIDLLFLKSSPDIKPMSPKATICHGVQGP